MIDLINQELPNTIRVDGKDYSIYTDFRKWMKFENSIINRQEIDVRYLFKNEYPFKWLLDEKETKEFQNEVLKGLLEFSRPKNELPRVYEKSDVIAIDYVIDSDYIYSAFIQQYQINLLKEDLHWHEFLALLNGLKGTKLDEIIGYRFYKKDNRKGVDHYAELREAWAIEPPLSKEEKESLDEFSELFGG